MIKIQKENFNLEEEIQNIKDLYSTVGAITSFVGYVRDYNNNKNVKSIELEVYEEMAKKQLKNIIKNAKEKWNLLDCLIIHRFGKLYINEKIVLVCCLSEHRKESFHSCNFIMDYLKKDATFWKNEIYKNNNEWLINSS